VTALDNNKGKLPRGTDERAESLRLAREAVRYLNDFIAYLEPIIEQDIARQKALRRDGNFSADEPDQEM
jgi:hypothetical protein